MVYQRQGPYRLLVGVFDCISPSHLTSLLRTTRGGPVDVVLLGDDLAREVWGEPLSHAAARADLLCHLRCVGEVIVADTPHRLEQVVASSGAVGLMCVDVPGDPVARLVGPRIEVVGSAGAMAATKSEA